ncbi:MAG: PqqD family protein [Lachnospiraceae bacterium]|nr:PqqD family protein [Lachnospiraceae bacterium]
MLKINKDYIMRKIADEYILVSTGKTALKFSGLITLTESAYLLWKHLEDGGSEKDFVKVLLENYEIDELTAAEDVSTCVKTMVEYGIFVEE